MIHTPKCLSPYKALFGIVGINKSSEFRSECFSFIFFDKLYNCNCKLKNFSTRNESRFNATTGGPPVLLESSENLTSLTTHKLKKTLSMTSYFPKKYDLNKLEEK